MLIKIRKDKSFVCTFLGSQSDVNIGRKAASDVSQWPVEALQLK